jgi:serine/threonine protein kinase
MPAAPASFGAAKMAGVGTGEADSQPELSAADLTSAKLGVRGNSDALSLEERYKELEIIGTGVYGTVYKARDSETDTIVALKRLRLDDESGDGVPAHVIREVSLLRDFSHPNIVQLLGIQVMGLSDYSLVFEYVETDLHQVLKSLRKEQAVMPLQQVMRYSEELLSGIHACHVRLIIHRDLKPQNILIHPQEGLKICDFGLARLFSMPLKPYTHDVVTLWYRAPEILLGSLQYGPEVDIWSAGCIMAEIATGQPTFAGDSEIGTIFRIFRLLGTPNADVWPAYPTLENFLTGAPQWPPTGLTEIQERRPDLGNEGIDLLRRLISMNPQARIGSRRAKSHSFFKKE